MKFLGEILAELGNKKCEVILERDKSSTFIKIINGDPLELWFSTNCKDWERLNRSWAFEVLWEIKDSSWSIIEEMDKKGYFLAKTMRGNILVIDKRSYLAKYEFSNIKNFLTVFFLSNISTPTDIDLFR